MFGYQYSDNLEEGINSQNSVGKLSSECFKCCCFPPEVLVPQSRPCLICPLQTQLPIIL